MSDQKGEISQKDLKYYNLQILSCLDKETVKESQIKSLSREIKIIWLKAGREELEKITGSSTSEFNLGDHKQDILEILGVEKETFKFRKIIDLLCENAKAKTLGDL